LITTPLPSRPWQRIAADVLYFKENNYLLITDYYSRYLELAHLPDMTSASLIYRCKNIFARWGIPEQLVSDSGPNFASEQFKSFADDYGFEHIFVSARYPQANGAAERAVRTAKNILSQDDIFKALMVYRATPIAATGLSPAEMMLSRKIRTTLPVSSKELEFKNLDQDQVRAKDAKTKDDYRKFYDRRHSAKELPSLEVGDRVRVKTDGEKQWSPGVVKEIPSSKGKPRSYDVKINGRTLYRNRRHLKVDRSISRPKEKSSTVPVVPFEFPISPSPVPIPGASGTTTPTSTPPPINTPRPPSAPPVQTSRFGRVIKPVVRLQL
jgi:hypothetical protein